MKRVAVLVLAGVVVLAAVVSSRRVASPAQDDVSLRLAPPEDGIAFAQALEPKTFMLPRDHGPHFEYQTEWWYYTGNLNAPSGRRFGFQLTLFRRGLTPGPPADAGLATNQIYFAHFAVTDVEAGRHRFSERFARGAGGLAGATGSPYRAWIEDWTVASLNAEGSRVQLSARDGEDSLDLTLEAEKPLVRHGDRGLSPKSSERGNASYYVGYTRLRAVGRVTSAGAAHEVAGQAWFDHEWSTSALGPAAVGWDWFSLQLGDGRELMYFQIRRADGGLEPISGGTLVEPDGSTRRLLATDVAIEVLGHWTSAETDARYPSGWRLRVPSAQLDLTISPWIPAQEMRTSFTYWEGAVRLEGSGAGGTMTGQGYVELTGYSKTMKGVF
jgi:predicted secreted hydrolase